MYIGVLARSGHDKKVINMLTSLDVLRQKIGKWAP